MYNIKKKEKQLEKKHETKTDLPDRQKLKQNEFSNLLRIY